jgi:hypothetical protein
MTETTIEMSGTRTLVEKVTEIDSDPNGGTVITVTTTTLVTVDGVTTPTVIRTVTNTLGNNSTTTTTYPEYDGHEIEPVDYVAQPNTDAQTILEYTIVSGETLTNTITRNGDLNSDATEYSVTWKGNTYSVFDVIKSTGTNDGENPVEVTPAGRYDVTISGTAGTYTVNVTVLDDDFVFYINNVLVDNTGNRSVTISSP